MSLSKRSKLNYNKINDGWIAHTPTLLSDLRRIFLDAAGGHATLETTAFIIFAWDWMVGSCWWLCCCCCCDPCWWCGPNWFGVLPATGDRSAALIVWFGKWEACDSCVCEIHWSDSGISQGPSLEQKDEKSAKLISMFIFIWTEKSKYKKNKNVRAHSIGLLDMPKKVCVYVVMWYSFLFVWAGWEKKMLWLVNDKWFWCKYAW